MPFDITLRNPGASTFNIALSTGGAPTVKFINMSGEDMD